MKKAFLASLAVLLLCLNSYANVCFSEDFGSGSSAWTVESGSWYVTGEGEYAQATDSSNGRYISYYSGGSCDLGCFTYIVPIATNSSQPAGNYNIGVVFHYIDSNNYYDAHFHPGYTDGCGQVKKKVGGGEVQDVVGGCSTVSPSPLADNAYKTLKIVMCGSAGSAYYDNNLWASWTDSDLTGGTVGIVATNGALKVDNIELDVTTTSSTTTSTTTTSTTSTSSTTTSTTTTSTTSTTIPPFYQNWSLSYDGPSDIVLSISQFQGKRIAGRGEYSHDGVAVIDDGGWSQFYDTGLDGVVALASDGTYEYMSTGWGSGKAAILQCTGVDSCSVFYNASAELGVIDVESLAVNGSQLWAGCGEGPMDARLVLCNLTGDSVGCGQFWNNSADRIPKIFFSDGVLYAAYSNSSGEDNGAVRLDGGSMTNIFSSSTPVTSIVEFGGHIFLNHGGLIYRQDGGSWTEVYDTGAPYVYALENHSVGGVDYIYGVDSNGEIVYSSDGDAWHISFKNDTYQSIYSLADVGGILLAGTYGPPAESGLGDILILDDGATTTTTTSTTTTEPSTTTTTDTTTTTTRPECVGSLGITCDSLDPATCANTYVWADAHYYQCAYGDFCGRYAGEYYCLPLSTTTTSTLPTTTSTTIVYYSSGHFTVGDGISFLVHITGGLSLGMLSSWRGILILLAILAVLGVMSFLVLIPVLILVMAKKKKGFNS